LLLADLRCADACWCVNLSQGDKREYIIGIVGFGKQRPGQPEDSSIPQVRDAIAACWQENPGDRKSATELLRILSANDSARQVCQLNPICEPSNA
jgi:hypothetical protein